MIALLSILCKYNAYSKLCLIRCMPIFGHGMRSELNRKYETFRMEINAAVPLKIVIYNCFIVSMMIKKKKLSHAPQSSVADVN